MSRRIPVVYVTANEHKLKEIDVLTAKCIIEGRPVGELFAFEIRAVPIKEILEVDIALMVSQEVQQAYRQLKVPCIVEHAGLIFDGFKSYPGGLTKPMWNALGNKFLTETGSCGRRAEARAVVAYCDGQQVLTFSGSTFGQLAKAPLGTREFYWDTVFVPDTADPRAKGKTYAQIVDDSELGLEFKVVELSQSSRAMLSFLKYRLSASPSLWPRA